MSHLPEQTLEKQEYLNTSSAGETKEMMDIKNEEEPEDASHGQQIKKGRGRPRKSEASHGNNLMNYFQPEVPSTASLNPFHS